jgi:hypothetical protein
MHSFDSFSAEPEPFSTDAWRELRPVLDSSNDPGCVLGPLASGLVNAKVLYGKPATFVVAQLGEPTKRSNGEFVYSVGQCHGWGWHDSELVVYLSGQNMVTEVRTRAAQ